jgi:hypothetical protein
VVLLGEMEIEGVVLWIAREPAEVGLAAVADRDVGQERVQAGVDGRGQEEARIERSERSETAPATTTARPTFWLKSRCT